MKIQPIDFTKGSSKTKFFSWKEARPNEKRHNRVYQAIMQNEAVSHVVNKVAEKRVFFNALRKRGIESKNNTRSGITKTVLKKVLGDIEHSKEFSPAEMRILRKSIVGGPYSHSIIRENQNVQITKKNAEQQRHTEVKKIYDEIVNKNSNKDSRYSSENNIEQQKKYEDAAKASPSQTVDFSVSNSNVRKLEPILFRNDRDIKAQQVNKLQVARQPASGNVNTNGYLANHLYKFGKHEDISKIKSMLASIQDKEDNEEESEEKLAA